MTETMSLLPLTVDSERMQRELGELAAISVPGEADSLKPGETAVTRVVFTEQDLEARAWLKRLAVEAGLAVREDAVGNTFFRWTGSAPELSAVATGSHIDAIPHAGMFDGTVGVLGGLEAMRALKASGFEPVRSIELILFTSEEPTRFGIGCLGSRLLSGLLHHHAAARLRDQDGRSLDETREGAGFSGSLDEVKLTQGHYAGFVELHIEQGPLLESSGTAIGVVTHIAAPASMRIRVEGEGGHAGAMLMPIRRDALAAASAIVLAVEAAALATGAIDTVATVGMCEVFPGAVNSVPSRVRLSVDVRDTDLHRRDGVLSTILRAGERIAAERGVNVTSELQNADSPATCDPQLLQRITAACAGLGLEQQHMVSRAYHDSLFMARVCPIAMIFIPSRGGVSHRPDEYSSPEAVVSGTKVLAHTLAALSVA